MAVPVNYQSLLNYEVRNARPNPNPKPACCTNPNPNPKMTFRLRFQGMYQFSTGFSFDAQHPFNISLSVLLLPLVSASVSASFQYALWSALIAITYVHLDFTSDLSSNRKVENAFEQFDENRDGVISFSEFLKMITSDPWKALLPLEVTGLRSGLVSADQLSCY